MHTQEQSSSRLLYHETNSDVSLEILRLGDQIIAYLSIPFVSTTSENFTITLSTSTQESCLLSVHQSLGGQHLRVLQDDTDKLLSYLQKDQILILDILGRTIQIDTRGFESCYKKF